jgi:hypothetical protein
MEEFIDNTKDYIDTRIKLAKLTLIEKGALIFAGLVSHVLGLIFLVLAFLFCSLALGFYISELLGNTYGGFFIVSLFYLVLAIIIYSIKDKYLEKPIVNSVIKKMFKYQEEED